MKKILLVMIIVLFTDASVFCGDFEDTLNKAEQGDAGAQLYLGIIYSTGHGVTQDHKQAVYWYKKAAEQGCAGGQLGLGSMYADGQGVPQDYKQAVHWYTKAAEQGHVNAQYDLGLCYANGKGVPQDYKKAVHWYTKAAEQGNEYAQFALGSCYYIGKGVPHDYKKAVYWYTKAAEGDTNLPDLPEGWRSAYPKHGLAAAQFNLGVMYDNGQGVTQNFPLAYAWFSLAAAQGDEKAIKNRDITAKKLTSQQLSEAQDLAAKIQYQINNPSDTQTQPPTKTDSDKAIGSGTGFFITRDGHILTCLHVVQDAARIEIYIGDKVHPASLVRSDPNSDLAILKVNGSFPALAFSPHRSAKMGQDVFTVGYPNPGLQGVSVKYTKGTVSSLTGYQDDLRLYQISIPIQPGNSGGSLLDEHGNILGVVVAMLSAKTAFQMTGSLPQNVNYAVKSLYAQAMIDTMPEVAGRVVPPSRSKSNAIDNAQKSTVMVVCYD
jgi:uncharacterized protein